jgi:Predicted AAA-ATPase
VADIFKTQFFAVMKRAMGVVVRKYWLTGVLPAFRDGISPLSATSVISMLPQYHGLCGLTREEVDAIAMKYLASTHTPNQIMGAMALMKSWYNGYMFSPPEHDKLLPRLFNPQLVFTHLRALSVNDASINSREEANATHSAIVLSAITGRGITPFDLIPVLTNNLDVNIMNEFGPRELRGLGQDHNQTWSLLYYLGVITHNDNSSSMQLPNASMRVLVSTLCNVLLYWPMVLIMFVADHGTLVRLPPAVRSRLQGHVSGMQRLYRGEFLSVCQYP